MKRIYPILIPLLIFSTASYSQTHFRKGYDIDYNSTGSIPSKDLNFLDFPGVTNDYFTGGTAACSGGLKHITKLKQGGLSQAMLNMDNGQPLDIDFGLYPYATIRVQSTANTDIQMWLTLRGAIHNQSKTFTIKGGGAWTTIRIDYSNQIGVDGGSTNEIQWGWNEPGTTTYPYELYFDYIKFGDLGDPDTAVKMGVTNVTPSPQIFEKDAGEQTIALSGITNGIDVTNLALSQTNTKSSIFEGVPTFDPIQPDGTSAIKLTSKTGTIGATNMQVLLTYNRGDTVIKYKSIWFDINIVADPKMTVPLNVNGQMNQPKVNIKITAGTNSIGGSSKLGILATALNPDLITNLKVDGDTIKSDGTATLSFIPGLDKCGTDTVTAVITDKVTSRTKEYKITVNITDPSNLCTPEVISLASATAKLDIFPNPADDKATITLPGSNGFNLSIVDITGRTIQHILVPAGQKEITLDLSRMNAGIYFITAANGTVKSTKKLIVK